MNALLSPRQIEVLRLAALSKKRTQIASALGITTGTVGDHLSAIGHAIGCAGSDYAAITRWAVKEGLIKI